VPRQLAIGTVARFSFDLAPPAAGWQNTARIRIQADQPITGEWHATFNGTAIEALADVTEPFAVPYPSLMGQPEELRAWSIPAQLLRDGRNVFEVTQVGGVAAKVMYLDLAAIQAP
jgi:hypothetical protein